MMRYSYFPSSNTSTNGATLEASSTSDTAASAGRDMEVFKVIVGAPVSSGNFYLYDKNNPVNGATTDIALKLTMGAAIATTQVPLVFDLTNEDGSGLRLGSGGNVIIDQTMQVTVLWGYADEHGSN